jgi:hypothetical protein
MYSPDPTVSRVTVNTSEETTEMVSPWLSAGLGELESSE